MKSCTAASSLGTAEWPIPFMVRNSASAPSDFRVLWHMRPKLYATWKRLQGWFIFVLESWVVLGWMGTIAMPLLNHILPTQHMTNLIGTNQSPHHVVLVPVRLQHRRRRVGG
jgi:hypothetical protein